jgi:anti-anti-sigma factor
MSNLRIERTGGCLALEGELDLAAVAALEGAVEAARSEGAGDVVLDLRELAFMDSSGLRTIVQLDTKAGTEGWRLAIVQGPEAVQRVFEITRMDQRLTFTDPT